MKRVGIEEEIVLDDQVKAGFGKFEGKRDVNGVGMFLDFEVNAFWGEKFLVEAEFDAIEGVIVDFGFGCFEFLVAESAVGIGIESEDEIQIPQSNGPAALKLLIGDS